MDIKVEKLSDISLMQWACAMTIDSESNMTLEKMYKVEHSPMRTQLFKITMLGIPTFVSTHFVRHDSCGQLHFCKTQRDDRGGSKDSDRWTPTNHGMILNAQHLIDMSLKRLCNTSHHETVKVMSQIRWSVMAIDRDLGRRMVPNCVYRRGCYELKSCGYYKEGK